MAVTIVAYATNLASLTGDSANGNETFTPPSASSGDFLVWVGIGRATVGSPPATGTGGQTWTQLQNTSANPRQLNISYAEFNGTWSGDLAGANSTLPGTNFCFVLRDTNTGVTWAIETLTGPSGVAASTTHSTVAGTPSGNNSCILSIVQNAGNNTYSAFSSAGGSSSAFGGSGDYWNNSGGSGIAGYIWALTQATAASAGDVTATCSASIAYTRTVIAVRASGGTPPSTGGNGAGYYLRRRHSAYT